MVGDIKILVALSSKCVDFNVLLSLKLCLLLLQKDRISSLYPFLKGNNDQVIYIAPMA